MNDPHSSSPRRASTWLAILALLLAGAVFAAQWVRERAAANAPLAASAAASSQHPLGAVSSDRLLRIRVRDSVDGGALDANVSVHPLDAGAQVRALAADPSVRGARSAALAAGEYELRIGAAGHQRLSTRVRIDAAQPLPLTVWLPPTVSSDALDRLALKAAACARCAVFSGRVFDAASGDPLAGARVRSSQGRRTRSDRDGYFELPAQLPVEASAADALPATLDLTVESPGHRGRVFAGLPLLNDARALIVDLEPGQGLARSDRRHVQQRARASADLQRPMPAADAAQARADADAAARPLDPARPATVARAQALAAQSANVPVPASIRVGTNCSGRSCSSVSVYAFEDYVGRGLDEEWIASWNPQSLAAGAVAYRSYAAYYVAHPINGRYDICASTSCQAFDGDSVSATVAAAAATRGVVLTRDGASAAFSEYSSENNAWDDPSDGLSCVNTDLSCGNGRNGSPRNGWPCLSDEVGRGRGCFGHGRGMSQWGTQRWAANNGRDWRWIANHYFNGNNAPGGQRNAYLANDGAGPGPGAVVLDDFETGVGRFDSAPTYSGSTVGISAASLAQRDCATRRNGACSLRVLLKDDPGVASAWSVRLLSGGGTPANNVELIRAGGRVGLWIYTGGSGLRAALSVDDSDGTERSVERAIPANQWTYLEWTLADDAHWNAWAGASNGRIDAAGVRLDAVWLLREQTSFDVNLYLDDVQIVH
ncbi:SpoIID/LytB domain protein [Lysobacter enzymogenes]|uniref:SpoIID/LytB domain protein n=1 Tax=Lysobacter enzymogenes TaxID=69 RepID=A0A0S2DP10_LYSEN|nr:SpoIID/LytB domain-containing protein [Lysobacter enzymogenes]ALN60047.1 SpoIID/LytB domain protein [Lysobacter enzymogenes]